MELLEKFRRHYHKVRKIISELKGQNLSSLKVEYRNNRVYTDLEIPDHALTIRLVVLMRRFLNDRDDLYYKNIWSYLQKHFSRCISSSILGEIENRIEKLNKGQMRFTFNNEVLTADKIYGLISEAGYFNDDKNVEKKLDEFSQIPLVKPFFWHQFFGYTLDGFYLISLFFDLMKEIEKTEEWKVFYPNEHRAPFKCIYCLKSSEPFTSIEHIIPEGLGNEELILPKGFVCDTCNNEILSELDNYLQEFEPISFLRVIYTQFTKDGKLPEGNYQNISIKKTHPRNILLSEKDKSGGVRNLKEADNGQVSFSIDFKGRRFDPKKLGRSLYKIAIGMVAYDRGAEAVNDSKYNEAREFILNGVDFPNNLLISMNGKPNAQVRVMHQELGGGTGFAIDIFGMMFLLNLQPFPVVELRKELDEANFKIFPLHS